LNLLFVIDSDFAKHQSFSLLLQDPIVFHKTSIH
jgi:hypothetical protein